MKFLVVVSFCFLCFLGSTVGLQCYQCVDKSPHTRCKNVAVETCGPDKSDKYCATASYVDKSGESDVRKGCMPKVQDVCKVDEIVKLGPGSNGKVGSLLCCEGSLCNSSNKLNYQNTLLYAILLGSITSMINYLLN